MMGSCPRCSVQVKGQPVYREVMENSKIRGGVLKGISEWERCPNRNQ